MNKATWPVVLVAGVIMILVLSGGMEGDSGQPIVYSHAKHVEENGMDCLDCHKYAEENARASIPNIETCGDCHEEVMTENEAEEALVAFIKENKRIPWRQVYSVPDYAYFSHRRHVKLAGLECIACHGEVGKFAMPITEPFVEISMEWCMDCHANNGVSNDCYACHR